VGSRVRPASSTVEVSPRDIVLTIIVAAAENGVIGVEGGLPWRLSSDLKRFKSLTMGKSMLMGRTTFESIGRALPGRRSVVLTRREEWSAPGAETAHGLDEALAMVEAEGEAFVIGGGELYRQTLPLASVVELTRVRAAVVGDVTFPSLDAREWERVAIEEHGAGERDEYPFAFETWRRIG